MDNKSYDSLEITEGGSSDKSLYSVQVMEQYRACIRESSKEKTTGGIIYRIINGEKVEVAVPNQLEIFINTVDALFVMLTPYVVDHQDHIGKEVNDFDDRHKKIKEHAEKLRKQYTKKFNSMSTKKGPNGISERDLHRDKYKLLMKEINEREELSLYEANKYLLVAMTKLLKRLNWFEELGS